MPQLNDLPILASACQEIIHAAQSCRTPGGDNCRSAGTFNTSFRKAGTKVYTFSLPERGPETP
jgi:hypothetical protein